MLRLFQYEQAFHIFIQQRQSIYPPLQVTNK